MSSRSRAHPWFADFAFDVNRHAHHHDRREFQRYAEEERDFWALLRDLVRPMLIDPSPTTTARAVGDCAVRLAARHNASLDALTIDGAGMPPIVRAMAHAISADRGAFGAVVLSDYERKVGGRVYPYPYPEELRE